MSRLVFGVTRILIFSKSNNTFFLVIVCFFFFFDYRRVYPDVKLSTKQPNLRLSLRSKTIRSQAHVYARIRKTLVLFFKSNFVEIEVHPTALHETQIVTCSETRQYGTAAVSNSNDFIARTPFATCGQTWRQTFYINYSYVSYGVRRYKTDAGHD